MEQIEYTRLGRFETWYWWYLAQRENLLRALGRAGLRPGARVLDAGCGTGLNLEILRRQCPVHTFGFDVSMLAGQSWRAALRSTCCVASVNDLPYADERFDFVYSVDVLDCRGVQLQRAVVEIARVLRPGGAAVLLAPACPWLRSTHDEAVHSVRRFTARELRSVVSAAGLHVEQAGYRHSLLFPLVALVRLLRKRQRVRGEAATSDLAPLPGWVNRVLLAISRVDQRLAERVPLPFGSTVVLVARKEAA